MKRTVILLIILLLGYKSFAQNREMVSVLELNKVLSDYYKNLNVYCSDSSSEYEKDVAHSALTHILTSNIVPTNLYPEMKSELGILCTDLAVNNYLSMAKDSTKHWEYQIRHFNAKYIPVDTIKVNNDVYYTAQLIVDVNLHFKEKRKFRREADNRERITFIKKDQGVWSIIKTEPLGIHDYWTVDYSDELGKSTLDPETEFENFKYQYVEKFVDTTTISCSCGTKGDVTIYGLAIVRDMSGKAGLVTMGGNEIVRPVFDSIVINEHDQVAYHNGVKYELLFRLDYDYHIRDYNKKYARGLNWIRLHDKVESHRHEEVGCWVSDAPVSWGMWVTAMGGEIPQGCNPNTPVSGMSNNAVKKFLKQIQTHHVKHCVSCDFFVLDSNQSRKIQRNENHLWLAEKYANFVIALDFQVYNYYKYKCDVNLQKNNHQYSDLDIIIIHL